MQNEPSPSSTPPRAPDAELRIYLLGSLRIERDTERIHLPRRKVESLLAYLLLHPEQHARDQLATLFWGDSSDAQARHSLRTALATMRKAVAADLLLADRDHVQLNPLFPVWVDLHAVLALEHELESASSDLLTAQLALWQGELLSGFYDEWLTAEREYYRRRLLGLCLQAIQALRARSEYGSAIAVAQQVLTFDPANEAAHQHMIFCHVASGDRAAALRQYEFCERALLAELNAPPMAETTALYQWIKQQDGAEKSPAARITNLPIPFTSFVGRTRQMAEVKRLLNPSASKTRLLTLTGAGGSGKTRLAIQVATDLIDSFAYGVWWVELAALNKDDLVVRTVAKTLGVPERTRDPYLQSVINFLGSKQLLLVIDNCEHLIEPLAHLAAELLCCCPNLQILTTSREPLNVTGETLWQVPTLELPAPHQVSLTDLLLRFECIRLFFERANAVQPGFRLTLENAPAVVKICIQLDGIPLAIELAAARVKVLSVEQIAAYLTSTLGARFALLTQGSRTILPRQQTLRHAIDWSYALLNNAERRLFRQVAVFQGGFTLQALEQVVNGGADNTGGAIHHALLDLLTQLVDKSLVISEPQRGENRYRLLETLREYALEQFTAPDELESLQRRHAEFFLHLAEQAEPALRSAAQQHWLARLEAEHANLRAALSYATASADRELALGLTATLEQFWDIRVYLSEGREWLNKALARRGSASVPTQARALSVAGFLAQRQDDYPVARHFLDESLSLFEHAKDEAGIADVLRNLALVDMRQGHYRVAQQRLEQSLALFRTLNHSDGMARVLNNLGNWAWDQNQTQAARDYYGESLAIRKRMGDQVGIATVLFNLGNTARAQGDCAAAHTYYEECLMLSRALDHRALIGIALKNLGLVAFLIGDYPKAQRNGEEALSILLEIGDKSDAGFTLNNLGYVAQKLGEPSQALLYFCQGLQLMHELGHIRGTFLSLEAIVELLVDIDQQLECAVRLLSAAARLRKEADIAVPPSKQPEYDRILTHLHRQLDPTTFRSAWATGQTAPLVQVVDQALTLSFAPAP
jgi:non-specific serine/threonine protein kinase